ncbi:MAG: UDP-N-acetylmuramoyl-L-alanyl-D-glutamate--2,6-diaminopimelate ligase [Clostridia bacterium]|nr:UDP-N-acetylmuramoyl-L-alanyl-D-glutamate--2,6-diaminopimelate ligase [Clostridia bacterium]
MKLYDIISNLKFTGIKNYQELDINSLTCDSKEKVENGIYFCLKGLNSDGHDYALESIKNGAVCLVVEDFIDAPVTQIKVENARVAMSFISSIFYETYKSKMKFLGMTGTNGKTTTTFLLREILLSMGKKVGLIGTEGIFINSLRLPPMLTTPDPINLHKVIRDMENNGCEFCVMEVSAHAIALNKIDNIYYDVVGLSNITKDHLDFFLNMENYIKCKASLFDVRHAKSGVVNIDAKYCKEIAQRANIDIVTTGLNGDLKLLSSAQTFEGTNFKLEYRNKQYSSSTNLIGDYNVQNVMMAISILMQLGFSIKDVLNAIKHHEFVVPGRFNLLKTDSNFNVIIDFAHTPDGIKNVLSTLKKLPHSRIITVFGCGGNRDKTKRSEMGEMALKLSDYVVVTSDNPRDENPEMIIDEIVKNITSKNVVRITDRRSAIEYALSIAKQDDIVAILGKGAENYQEIKGIKTHFSDYEVVDEYFKHTLKSELKA